MAQHKMLSLRCPRWLATRRLSYVLEPLDKPVPGLVDPNERHPDTVTHPKEECKITRLENGLRIASQEAFGQYSTVGGEEGREEIMAVDTGWQNIVLA